MRPTKFSGPLLYSGQTSNSDFFSDLPIGFNPDFMQHWDDFTGKTIDTTDDYTFTALIYGFVFLLWVSWTKCVANSLSANEK